jgi:hypothetical protein
MEIMGRGVQAVIVCEDTQHEVFVRAFLRRRGFTPRDLRFEKSPPGKGDAKQFVRERFVVEVKALRAYAGERRMLLAMTDADDVSTAERRDTLIQACIGASSNPPAAEDPIYVFIPKWEIETWLKFLRDGGADESVDDLPKLPDLSETYVLVNRLVDEMCDRQNMPQEAPSSLKLACEEYKRMMRFLKA